MCPLGLPFCLPIDIVLLFLFLTGLGLSFKEALLVTAVAGVLMTYITYQVCKKGYYKIKAYLAKRKSASAVKDQKEDAGK